MQSRADALDCAMYECFRSGPSADDTLHIVADRHENGRVTTVCGRTFTHVTDIDIRSVEDPEREHGFCGNCRRSLP